MKKRQIIPIQRRLIGFLLFVSLVPLGAMGSYGTLVIDRHIKYTERYKIANILTATTVMTRNLIANAQDELLTISDFSEICSLFMIERGNEKEFENALSRAKAKLKAHFSRYEPVTGAKFSRVSFIGGDGLELYRIQYAGGGSWIESDSLKNYSGDNAFSYIRQFDPSAGGPGSARPRVFMSSMIDDTPGIVFLIPFYSNEDGFSGILLAVLDYDHICDALVVHQRTDVVKAIPLDIYLVNQEGDLVYASALRAKKGSPSLPEKKLNIQGLLPSEVTADLLLPTAGAQKSSGKKGVLGGFVNWFRPPETGALYDREDQIYLHDPIIFQNPVSHKASAEGRFKKDYLVVIARAPLKEIYKAAAFYRELLQKLLVLFTILSIVTGVYLSRNFLSPINKLIKGTEEIAKGNWQYSLTIPTGDEFENLANHFNTMVEQLKTLYSSIEQKVIERTRELAETQEILAREKEQLEAVLNTTREGIIMIDLEGHRIFENRSFDEMFEFSIPAGGETKKWNIRELVSRKELFQEPERYLRELENLLGKPDEVQGGQIVRLLPRLLIINWFSAPVEVQKGITIGRIMAFRDVTREKEVERMKDEFVSIVSHELRTPMTSLGGSLSLVLDGTVGEINEDQRELLEIAKNNTTRLIRLINDILDISKIESGKIKMKREPVNISKVIDDSVEGIKTFAADHGVSVSCDRSGDIPELTADKDRLIQVVTNLLSNAIKFSPEAGTVHVKTWIEDEKMYLSVRDEGPGIPADYLEKIFEKFQQVDSSSVRQKGGTGLGLPICRAIIGELNGKLWVDSVEEQGSTFTFFLPLGAPEKYGQDHP